MSTARPFMPFYVADYMVDTGHLTCEQHGAYCLLLFTLWNAGGRLPNDEKILARICKLTIRRWRQIGAPVMALFQVWPDRVEQKRVTKELRRIIHLSEVRAEAGRAGGIAKSAKHVDQKESLTSHFSDHTRDAKPLKSNDADVANARSPRARPAARERALPQTPDMFSESNDSESSSSSPKPAELEREFGVWWSRITNKVGKGNARSKYAIARRQVSAQTLLDAWARYERDKPPDRPWCHPATWLHQERWTDEPAPQPVVQRMAPAAPKRQGIGDWAAQQLQAMEQEQPDNVIEVTDYEVRKAQRG